MLTRFVVFLLVAVASLLPAQMAWAVPPVTCADGSVPDRTTGACTVVVEVPPVNSSTGGEAPSENTSPTCSYQGELIPCLRDGAWWSPPANCYISPQPGVWDPASDVWGGHYPDGMVYLCANPYSRRNYSFWSLTVPPGPAAPTDPRGLAQQAIGLMTFRAITIGMVPLEGTQPDGTPYVGLVGMPVWMWVADPSAETVGPQVVTVTAGGVSVTASATLAGVVWDMGDGRGQASLVSCGRGTPYEDRYQAQDSPSCGYRYQVQGTYTVTATSRWQVAWSGGGQSGVIPVTVTGSRQVLIGEVQVLRQ